MIASLETACGEDPGALCRFVFEQTSNEALATFAEWFLNRPIRIIAILIVAWIIARIAGRLIGRFALGLIDFRSEDPDNLDEDDGFFERRVEQLRYLGDQQVRAKQRAVTLGAVLTSISRASIWFVASMLVLGELEINLAPLLAGAGVAGLAVGFGAQSLVRDFLAGIFFIVEDHFGVGDVIDLGPAVGTVEEVTLRTTRLRDVSGVLWIIPNGEISRVGNFSQLWSKSVLDIEVAYDTDLDFASGVIKQVLDDVWREQDEQATIIEEPQVLGLQEFGASALVIRAVVKTDPAEQWGVARIIRGRLKAAFDDAGIDIPFPQRTVWLRQDDHP